MDEARATPRTLLFHDGELSDVRDLLGALRLPFVERRSRVLPQDLATAWDLVVATPQRLLERPIVAAQRIAVCDRETNTLRASLQRAGVRTLVRRPVHPAALRALLLHALYRGPEKRRVPRTPIGAAVTIRSGWRQRAAVLADLSLGGCRVICAHAPPPGKTFTLCVPATVGGGQAFQVKARVLRQVDDSDPPGCSARFEAIQIREAEHLKRTLRAHAQGPARIEVARGATALPASTTAPVSAATPPAPVASLRVEDPREGFDRRVAALAEEADRVLVGRDVSVAGMRVAPNPRLSVGDDVRLAMHVEQLSVPLMVTAKVHRDDGERGLLLRFHHLAPETARAIDAMRDAMPMLEPGPSTRGAGLVVSEILPG